MIRDMGNSGTMYKPQQFYFAPSLSEKIISGLISSRACQSSKRSHGLSKKNGDPQAAISKNYNRTAQGLVGVSSLPSAAMMMPAMTAAAARIATMIPLEPSRSLSDSTAAPVRAGCVADETG
jgi:hypothetical protein